MISVGAAGVSFYCGSCANCDSYYYDGCLLKFEQQLFPVEERVGPMLARMLPLLFVICRSLTSSPLTLVAGIDESMIVSAMAPPRESTRSPSLSAELIGCGLLQLLFYYCSIAVFSLPFMFSWLEMPLAGATAYGLRWWWLRCLPSPLWQSSQVQRLEHGTPAWKHSQ